MMDNYDNQELMQMQKKALQWKKMGLKYVVVIGIGGSYIGVKAAIDMCTDPFNDEKPEIIYLPTISSSYVIGLLNKLKQQKFGIVVISKSGNTLEPSIGFRLFRQLLEKNVGKSAARNLIVAITDANEGILHDLAKHNGYTMFSIPSNIGGRYSTLTPVGMFTMILKGLDPLKILAGAHQALKDLETCDLQENSAYLYACYRHYFYTKLNYQVENFIVYSPDLLQIGEQ